MKVAIVRKRFNDTQVFTGVTRAIINKNGRFFPSMDIEVKFGEGATSHYNSRKHAASWKINHKSNPGMESMGCDIIEIFEDHSLDSKVKTDG